MTLEEIKTYQRRKEAIKSIDDEIEWIYGKVSSPNGNRSGGTPSSPGDPTAHNVNRIQRLQERRASLVNRQEACEAYVDGLEDYRVATILRYRYILGWTWESTALRILGSTSYQSLIRAVHSHFGVETTIH